MEQDIAHAELLRVCAEVICGAHDGVESMTHDDPGVAICAQMLKRVLSHDNSASSTAHLIKECERVKEHAWDELHHGYWKDVPAVWRMIFAWSSLCAVALGISSNVSDEAALCERADAWLRALDMVLLFGTEHTAGTVHGLVAEVEKVKGPAGAREVAVGSKRSRVAGAESPRPAMKRPRRRLNGVVGVAQQEAIPSVHCPSIQEFDVKWRRGKRPIVITGAMEHWKAMGEHNWSDLSYLKRIMGHRTVPVEIGRTYLDDDWRQELMTVDEFIDQYIEGDDRGEVGYIAQTALFDQVLPLRRDVCIPDYCAAGIGDEVALPTLNAWFGPPHTITPCHTDPKDNLLCQVVGRKYVCLFPPADSEYLYPVHGMLRNNSSVDIEQPDLTEYPRFALAHAFECELVPGQMLFIPSGWWHYVRSMSTSFSVSCWW